VFKGLGLNFRISSSVKDANEFAPDNSAKPLANEALFNQSLLENFILTLILGKIY
jgi:hypothetical protein